MGHTEARYGFQSIPQPVVLDMNGGGGGNHYYCGSFLFLLSQGENDVLIFFSGGMNYFH